MTPRIVLTVQAPSVADDAERARWRNEQYAEAVTRHGGEAIVVDETTDPTARASAFAEMDGLLLTGGADLDPSLYGEAPNGSERPERGRDGLEQEAWTAARERQVPIFGICRGHQTINVLMGGRLVQHLEHHPAGTHRLDLIHGTRVADVLAAAEVAVNSSHHQGIRANELAPGLRVSGTSADPDGELIEAFESAAADEFLIGVQCHPEREPKAPFEPLWAAFVEACAKTAEQRTAAETVPA